MQLFRIFNKPEVTQKIQTYESIRGYLYTWNSYLNHKLRKTKIATFYIFMIANDKHGHA